MPVRRFLSPILVAVLCGLVPAAASAAPVTIGQVPATPPPFVCLNSPFEEFQINVAEGNGYEVPQGYTTLVSWSTYSSLGSFEEFSLRVYDRQSSASYVVEREDGPRTLAFSSLNTFKADVPVGKGDIIGVEELNGKTEPNACTFATGDEADEYANAEAVGVHETGSYSTLHEGRVNVRAVLERPPGLTLISPSSGSTAGGTRVKLAGHDLTGAEAVRFGTAKAQFKFISDEEIEATAPAAAGPGSLDVIVTTAAGTTAKVSGDVFTYIAPAAGSGAVPGPQPTPTPIAGCVVPKLKDKSLKSARKALKRADCGLGKVRGSRAKRAVVKKQGAKPGTLLPAGGRVSVKLAGF